MSDRNKYRAWDGKKMHYPAYFAFFRRRNKSVMEFSYEYGSFQSYSETFMQCIGRKGKNNKLLFEGDIVQKHDCYDGENTYTTVSSIIFDHDGFCLKKISGSPKSEAGGLFGFPSRLDELEVIGDIYENPDLLIPPRSEESSE